jgi:sulfur relay (sulfurtransferase) DsrF/TusC family protein
MSLSIAVVVRENPFKTHRAAEALRIALGLSTGNNPLTIILLNEAPVLLAEEPQDLVDADTLSTHLPVVKELKIPFVVPCGAKAKFALDLDFAVSEASPEEIAALIKTTDRVLAF